MKQRNETQIRAMLAARVSAAGSQVALAKSLGISPVYISDVLNGRRSPGKTLLKALGYRRLWVAEPLDGA